MNNLEDNCAQGGARIKKNIDYISHSNKTLVRESTFVVVKNRRRITMVEEETVGSNGCVNYF